MSVAPAHPTRSSFLTRPRAEPFGSKLALSLVSPAPAQTEAFTLGKPNGLT